MIEVLAAGENDVIGRGGPFNIGKFFVALDKLYIKMYWKVVDGYIKRDTI